MADISVVWRQIGTKSDVQYLVENVLCRQLEAATVFEMSRPLAEPTLRPTMSAKDEMTPARSRAPREVSASAASSRHVQPR